MSETPKQQLSVSIIIPTYNRADLLREALESALNQTRPADEILVVDDGSTDGTEQLLEQFGPPVRALKQSNQGVSAARNFGMRAAQGDTLVFLDSDDLLLPRCVELCAGALEANPDAVAVYSDFCLVDNQGNHLGLYSEAERDDRPSGMILDQLAQRCIVNMSAGTVRRAYLDGCEFDTNLGPAADYDFWRLLAAKRPFVYVDDPTCCYRYHGAQMITAQRDVILDEAIEVQRRIMAMPEFALLSRQVRAATYCTHGVKNALRGRIGVARWYFARATRTAPLNLSGPALLSISMLGDRLLRFAIETRRRWLGNRIDGQAVNQAVPVSGVRPLADLSENGNPEPLLVPTK